MEVDYDNRQQRWVGYLNRGEKQVKTFLELGDEEFCMSGKNTQSVCFNYGLAPILISIRSAYLHSNYGNCSTHGCS